MRGLKTFFSGEKATSDQLCPRWLILGGTGRISSDVTEYLRHGHQVTCLNRGSHPLPAGVEHITCDVNDESAVTRALEGKHFDVVVDFLTFTPDEARMRSRAFLGKCRQYMFISTADAYEKPVRTLFTTEKTPLINPWSPRAQQKILCEGVFRAAHRQQGLPLTIIRPGLTYGTGDVPFILRPDGAPYTLLQRLRAGKPLPVAGDGTVFHTITHASDLARALAGLAANPDTIGEDFHIAQDECITWNAVAQAIAQAAGAPQAKLCHIATDELVQQSPVLRESLLGSLAHTAVFDNSKLRQFVPGFRYLTSFRDGIKQSVQHLDTHPASQTIDEAWNAWADELFRRRGAAPL